MNKPTLGGLAEWMDADLVKRIDERRRKYGEIQRDRKLGTLEMLWLMLAVSLNTSSNSLHEILRLTTAAMGMDWSVSTAAFCKARIFFR